MRRARCSQAFVEPVELIGADEVHLADQGRVVAGGLQIVGVGRVRAGELGAVVVRTDLARQPARQHREPARCTQREVRVRRLEHHRPFRQRIEVRCLGDRVAVRRQERGCELVDLDEEDVRLSHGRVSRTPAEVRPVERVLVALS